MKHKYVHAASARADQAYKVLRRAINLAFHGSMRYRHARLSYRHPDSL